MLAKAPLHSRMQHLQDRSLHFRPWIALRVYDIEVVGARWIVTVTSEPRACVCRRLQVAN